MLKGSATRSGWVQWAEAEQTLSDATEALGPSPGGNDLALVLEGGSYLAVMAGDASTAIDLADRALETAGPDMAESFILRCLVHKGVAANLAHYPDGRDLLNEVGKRATTTQAWLEAYRASLSQADMATDNYDVAVASDHARNALALSADSNQPGSMLYVNAVYAKALLLQGDWDRAEELAREQLAGTAGGVVELVALPVIGTIETRTGRTSASQTLDRAWELAARSMEFQRLAPSALAIVEHAWVTGDIAGIALSEIEDVMESGQHRGGKWLSGSIAFWLRKLSKLDEIPEWIVEPFRLVMSGEPMGAAEIWAARGCPYERAMALVHGGTSAKLEALVILDRLGATAATDKLRQELLGSGIAAPRRRPRRSIQRPELTTRQTEVLALLSEQLSNVEIADQLFLSPRTVEHHVAAILSKLNASSRHEAVEKATDRGLLAAV